MKKYKVYIILFLIIVLSALTFSYLKYRSKPIKMYYQNEIINSIHKSFKWQNVLYLPVKSVLNSVDRDSFVKFNKELNKIYANVDGKRVVITAGNNSMTVDNENFKFSVSPVIEDGVFYVPSIYLEKLKIYPKYNSILRRINILKTSSVLDGEKVSDSSKYEYSEDENLIYYKKENGEWERYLHDENDNIIFSINSDSKTVQYQYNSDLNVISSQDSYNNYSEYIYNEYQKLIYKESSDGTWEKYDYDDNLNLIGYENSKGEWIRYSYDEEKNLIKKEFYDGKIENYKVVTE